MRFVFFIVVSLLICGPAFSGPEIVQEGIQASKVFLTLGQAEVEGCVAQIKDKLGKVIESAKKDLANSDEDLFLSDSGFNYPCLMNFSEELKALSYEPGIKLQIASTQFANKSPFVVYEGLASSVGNGFVFNLRIIPVVGQDASIDLDSMVDFVEGFMLSADSMGFGAYFLLMDKSVD